MVTDIDTNSGTKLTLLKNPKSYPFRATKVKMLETHMSWVFLTDDYVVKLKKPIKLDLIDFSTPEARHKNCLEELRVNRRLAKGVYLGILPLTSSRGGQLALNGSGKAVDWLIWMKRLPKEKTLESAIAAHNINKQELKRSASTLADFYINGKLVDLGAYTYVSWITCAVLEDGRQLLAPEYNVPSSLVNRVIDALVSFIYLKIEVLLSRAEKMKIIEAHGDLRPEHIYLGPQPVFIDSLEFCKSLRILDIAEELSYLSMECDALGSTSAGKVFIDTYIQQSGDMIPQELLDFYKAKGALLRARLSIRHLTSPNYKGPMDKWKQECCKYLTMAEQYMNVCPNLTS
ncbi:MULTISPECIES: hypothetical protein [unclassified Imperialibacter]|uniref:hypothetical protein n=1 Tax=unclassified Imperialibacter TaxID=2629706 RepID=UPI0012598225|nr:MULTISPECIES: hypothetical protein [unclassified Imperialibacter]CAD5265621.1 conserved hypothetical protein [Imperialibacter sp. 89]CAD5270428.1 conserved hypothetical protein [Imperialibacter sp. 75]VVT10077.1 conserved hypothetical protein [Imperialibacter sp. EC-SDR9]